MKLRTGIVVAVLAGTSGSAFAVEHEMKVGEVMLSNQGSSASQFIELEDDANEPFPNSGYALSVFSADGTTSIGNVPLAVPAGTGRLLVASSTAATQFGVTPAATLPFTLPADGQACFDKGSAHIYCLGWGTISSQVVGVYGTTKVVSPPDGMSIQMVSVGIYNLGTPTPGAANTAPAPDGSPVLPDASVDAPMPPDDGAVAGPDAPGGNGEQPKDGDDGCSVGAGASWFGILALVGLGLVTGLGRRRGE